MRTVVVVDDSTPFRKQARRVLEGGGYRLVAEAATGRAGLEAAALNPSLFLIDIGLPDMTGFELAQQVGPSRVVLISGRDPRSFATSLRESGVLGFVAKEDLTVERIEAIMSGR